MTQPSYENIDTNAILQAVESGQDYNPEPAQSEPVQEPAQQQQAVEQQPKFYEFNWNGQPVRGTEDQLLKWASQGYDYSQKMAQINQAKEEYESKYGRYKEIDEFVRQNPDWWNHVEQNWNSRETYNLDPNIKKVLDPYLQELSAVKSFINDYQRTQLEQKAKEDDQKLDQEIGSLRQRFPDVDFASKDELGQSLELRVIRHANERGIPSFSAAFYDYYQDNLAKIYEARGRTAIEKDLQKRKASGLLGESQAPVKQQQLFGGQRPSTYDDAYKNALQELGLA